MPGPQPCHYRPFIFCFVGRGLDPSAERRGRRPLQTQAASLSPVVGERFIPPAPHPIAARHPKERRPPCPPSTIPSNFSRALARPSPKNLRSSASSPSATCFVLSAQIHRRPAAARAVPAGGRPVLWPRLYDTFRHADPPCGDIPHRGVRRNPGVEAVRRDAVRQ